MYIHFLSISFLSGMAAKLISFIMEETVIFFYFLKELSNFSSVETHPGQGRSMGHELETIERFRKFFRYLPSRSSLWLKVIFNVQQPESRFNAAPICQLESVKTLAPVPLFAIYLGFWNPVYKLNSNPLLMCLSQNFKRRRNLHAIFSSLVSFD